MNRMRFNALMSGVALLAMVAAGCGNESTYAPPASALQAEIPSGSPLASIIFEEVEYTFEAVRSVTPGESTSFVIDGIEVNVAVLKLVGTTTEGSPPGLDRGLEVYRSSIDGDSDAVYTFSPGGSQVNPEDGQILEFQAEWVRWTATGR